MLDRIYGVPYYYLMKLDVRTFMDALAEPTRLRSLVLLTGEQPLCVCELTAALDVSQPKMSRHLATLRDRGIVEDRKVANRVFYRLRPDLPQWATSVLENVTAGTRGAASFEADRSRLAAMAGRPDQSEVRLDSWPARSA